MAMTASAYDLTVGTTGHGTLTFLVNDNAVTTAAEGDVVTVKVDAAKGYIGKAVTARRYAVYGLGRRQWSIDCAKWNIHCATTRHEC